MSDYHVEMLAASRLLLEREPGKRGRLPAARVRRSISTSYYALFHFLLDECATKLIGTENHLRRRRRIFARVFTHKVVKTALGKVRGARLDSGVIDYFVGLNLAGPEASTPGFARTMAGAFLQAHDQRHEADYDLNAASTALTADLLIERVQTAIAAWKNATNPAERDFKKALCLLMALGGKLRPDMTG